MKRQMCSWALILTSLLLAGCSADGGGMPFWQSRSNTATPLIGAQQAYDIEYRPRWSTRLSLRNAQKLAHAVVLDDILITITEPGNLVSATALRNGEVLWTVSVATPTAMLFNPIRYEHSLYINSETTIYELDIHTGESVKSAPLAETVIGGPVLVDNRAVFGSVNGTVFAHSLRTGRYRWKYRMASPIVSPPVAVGFNVFVADSQGNYAMLFAQDGTSIWQGRSFGSMTVPPAFDRATLYLASQDTTLYAINRSTGEDRWKYPAAQPLTLPAKVIGLTVYLPIASQGLIALDSIDGGLRWKHDQPAWPVIERGDNLLAATSSTLQLLDINTGRVVKSVPTAALSTVLIGPDDSLVLITAKGRMMRIDPL